MYTGCSVCIPVALYEYRLFCMYACCAIRMPVVLYAYLQCCTYTDLSDASVVHYSGSGHLQANPHVAGPWISPGKSTRRAVTTMGSNDLVVGEDHMLGPSCQRYNWQTGR